MTKSDVVPSSARDENSIIRSPKSLTDEDFLQLHHNQIIDQNRVLKPSENGNCPEDRESHMTNHAKGAPGQLLPNYSKEYIDMKNYSVLY